MNKKGNIQSTLLVLILLAIVGGGAYYLAGGHVSTPAASVVPDGAASVNVAVSGLTSGFTLDDKDPTAQLVKFTDSQLNATTTTELNFTVTLNRNDFLRDLNGAGYIFSIDVQDLAALDSWNASVTTKQYLVSYDTVNKVYSVTVAGNSQKNLPYKVEVKQGTAATAIISIDLATSGTYTNVVQNQYDTYNPFKVVVTNSAGATQATITGQYTRTVA